FKLSGEVELTSLAADGSEAWCAVAKSASGKFFAASQAQGRIGAGDTAASAASDAGCSPATAPAGGTGGEVEASGGTASWTLLCNADSTVALPIADAHGVAEWSDGLEQTINGSPQTRQLAAGEKVTVTFDGTFASLSAADAGA